jgi:polysaccharide biosynthesis protein VpsM
MSKSRWAQVAVAAAFSALAVAGYGQTPLIRPAYKYPDAPLASGPAAIRLGETPMFAIPYLGLAAGHDDNVVLSHTDPKSSTFYLLSPGVTVDARDPNKVFSIGYRAQVGRFAQSTQDDYVDHTANAQFDMAIDRRNFIRLGIAYLRNHDPRGSTDRPISGSPDKYRLVSPNFTYALGSPGAQGRFEAYFSEADRRYLNNRGTTFASDRDARNFGGVFYWRVMPRTYLLAEARKTQIRYVDPASRLSADEERYYGGVSWDATAATTGTLKLGTVKRRFTSDLPSESASSWEATVTWAPRTYSKFDLYTVRTTSESTGLGNFMFSAISGVTWTHAWSSLISTGVEMRYQKDDYQGFNRTDETKSLGMKVGYRFRRWLTLGAEYSHTQRDSSINAFEWDRNLYLLTATASM